MAKDDATADATRRGVLGAGIGGALGLAFGRRVSAEPTPEQPGAIDVTPMLFKLGPEYIQVDPVDRNYRAVHRRDVLGHLPQPEPVKVERIPGIGMIDAVVIRTWAADPAPTCARCWACGAMPHARGDGFVCLRLIERAGDGRRDEPEYDAETVLALPESIL